MLRGCKDLKESPLNSLFNLSVMQPSRQVPNLACLFIKGFPLLRVHHILCLLRNFCPDILYILINRLDKQIVFSVPYNRKKVIFTDRVVTIHIIDGESCLLDRDHVVQKIHLLWSYPTVDDSLVKLLVKSIIVQSSETPVEEGTDLGSIPSVVPPREILLELWPCEPPIVNLLVWRILILTDAADSLESMLDTGLERRVVSLTCVVLVRINFET